MWCRDGQHSADSATDAPFTAEVAQLEHCAHTQAPCTHTGTTPIHTSTAHTHKHCTHTKAQAKGSQAAQPLLGEHCSHRMTSKCVFRMGPKGSARVLLAPLCPAAAAEQSSALGPGECRPLPHHHLCIHYTLCPSPHLANQCSSPWRGQLRLRAGCSQEPNPGPSEQDEARQNRIAAPSH